MIGTNRKQHLLSTCNARKSSFSIASIALIATFSFSTVDIQATVDETTKDIKITAPEKVNENNAANVMIKICDALVVGKITPEEAAKKTIAFIREQARWDRITNRIEGAVESGKITREEAIAKYAELKESKPKVNKQGSKRAEAYLQEVSTKLKAAVESGEITEAQAEERMESAKKQVATRLGSEKDNTNARVEAYLKKVGEEVRVAIANGEMTAEEGKAKYTTAVQRMKERMAMSGTRGEGRGAGRDRSEISDDCMDLRIKLGTAVRNGELTREEAGKIWKEEGC
jgi:polyhydroxyalkanoate synthesis regulator phasin